MKKSFKKAGAAVLSMAMLLAMGAVTMPVYADNTTVHDNTDQPWPGQIVVEIDGSNNSNAWADETASGYEREFSYLIQNEVKNATVKLYKVAEHGTDGWSWITPFAPDTAGLTLGDFDTLLDSVTVGSQPNQRDVFTANADDLMKLASYLERTAGAQNVAEVASEVIDFTNGDTYALLPTNNLIDNITKNHTAYYLISTVTDDAGVVIQPALITLKNSDDSTDNKNPIHIALKGTTINVDKAIEKVEDKTTHVTYAGDDAVTETHDSAIVAQNDEIFYTIKTQIPTYDPGVKIADLQPFTITDTPDTGIKIKTDTINTLTGRTNELVVLAGATAGAEGTPLEAGTDYNIAVSGNGFVITFDKAAMHTGTATLSGNKLEGMYITVKFTGTLDPNNEIKENTSDLSSKTYSNLTAADVTAMVTTAKTLRATNNTKFKDKADTVQALTSADETTVLALANGVLGLTGADALTAATNIDDVTAAAITLALEKLQRPGAENTSTITYANHYATGTGEAKKDSKVYHHNIDLRLDKIADALVLEGSYNDSSNEYSKDANAAEQAVEHAVFELIKVDESTGSAGDGSTDKSLGYCASKDDKHLYPLERTTTEPAQGTWSYRPDSTQNVWYVFKTGAAASKMGWDDLTVGEYKLKEVEAPTGYKPVEDIYFTVECDTFDASEDLAGEYNGEFSVNVTTGGDAVKGAAADSKIVLQDATAAAANGGAATDGELFATIKDPLADTLPATGGIGTVLFTAGGIAVVMLAGALFVVYMKKRSTEEEE